MEPSLDIAAGAPRPGIAERLWEAARVEFSQRGYHGARVQGIARRAGCNVALLYRHWSSKKALYLDVLKSVWQVQARQIVGLLERGTGAPAVVSAYLDVLFQDPIGSQVVIREILDGAPHIRQLVEAEPSLMGTVRAASAHLQLGGGNGGGEPTRLRPGLDPIMVVLTIGGLASLVASAHEVAQVFTGRTVSPEQWRQHLHDLLVNGIVPCK